MRVEIALKTICEIKKKKKVALNQDFDMGPDGDQQLRSQRKA